MKLIIPMAGRGTRVRPHSHVTPKPLLNICGKSMVERIIDTFTQVLPRPITDGVFILGPDFGQGVRNDLSAICERHGIQAHFGVQEVARGTAHAVACAGDHLEGEGIVVFADTLFYMEPGVDLSNSDVVAWVKEVDDPSRFGVAVRKEGRIVELVEKPQTLVSNEALIGIYYVRDLRLLRDAIDYLMENNVTGHGNEYQLTDAFDRLLKDGKIFRTASVTAWLDGGTIEAFLETTLDIVQREQGVLKEDDNLVDSVVIPPVFIGENVQIARSVVGPNVSIESGASISDSRVSNSIVFSDSVVTNSVLDGSLIGNAASLRGRAQHINIGDHSDIS
jgi:glucose-1-phosphate thymidylyltransferase